MGTILCFGDSNTYGYRPEDGKRYPKEVRWTGILAEKMKTEGNEVIEEGLVGRTTVFEDSIRPGRKGIDLIQPILESHSPVDQLVLMLGTNDCKSVYNASPLVIGYGMDNILKQVKKYDPQIKILLLSPIHLGEHVWKETYDPEFNRKSVYVSKKLKPIYSGLARKYGCQFLAASDFAKPSYIDQEHLSEEGHKVLAEAIYRVLSKNYQEIKKEEEKKL